MPKLITRTIYVSIIHAEEVEIIDGQFSYKAIPDIIVEGKKITDITVAIKEIVKVTATKSNYIIKGIDIEEKVYGVPVNVFMDNAIEVVRPKSQQRKGDK